MQRSVTTIVQLIVVVVVQFAVGAGVASAATKVACVGDSITEMPGWCTDLGEKLGNDYMVGNFGVSGTNLCMNVGQPYWTSRQFKPGHDFAPDVVVIMLGTNDSIPANWNAGKSHFVADYEEFIDTYTELASHPRVYAVLPPPIGTSPFGHDGDITAEEVIPAIMLAAAHKMVTTIDVFTAFGGKMFDPSLFGAMDQVHPSAKGHQLIADTVYAVLTAPDNAGGAGSGGSAGAAGSANGSSAGAGAGTGGHTGGIGGMNAAGAGNPANTANTAVAGSAAKPMTGATSAASGTSGSNASPVMSTRTAPAAAGSGTSMNTAGSTSSAVNSVTAEAPSSPPSDAGGCGCRIAENSTSKSGPAAALAVLLGLVVRSWRRRKNPRASV